MGPEASSLAFRSVESLDESLTLTGPLPRKTPGNMARRYYSEGSTMLMYQPSKYGAFLPGP